MNYHKRSKLIGDRIHTERKRLKLNRENFLIAVGWQPSSTKMLSAWEKGERLPDLDSLSRMAELFSCDVGYLLCDYDERTRDSADLCKLTGLSERAANTLLNLKENHLREITFLLESTNFENAIGYLADYWDAKKQLLGLMQIKHNRVAEMGANYTTNIPLQKAISQSMKDSDLNNYLTMQHLGFITQEIERIEREALEKNG